MRSLAYVSSLAAVFSLLLTVGLGEAGAQEAKTYKWNVPVIWTLPHHVRTEQEAMRARVLERTGGKMDISLFQFGEVGLVDSDVLSIVRSGDFPLVELDGAKTSGDEPLFLIFNLAGLASSIEDAIKIGKATEDLRKQALDEWNAVEIGLVHYLPPQAIFSKGPVRTIDDLRGLKLRVSSSTLLSAFKLVGSQPQLIPWGDVPAALLQGVVEGAVTSPSSGIGVGFADTTKYMTTMPLSDRISWIMNKDAWNKLPPAIQKVLREESKAAGDRIQANWNREEATVGKLVHDAGMTFVQPSKEFQAGIAKLLRPVWDEWAAKTKYGPNALKRALTELGRN
jgi:TRAP-type C4-dicarboxylate transport system substrate-binding protein